MLESGNPKETKADADDSVVDATPVLEMQGGDGGQRPPATAPVAAADGGGESQDPFDLNNLRLGQDFASQVGVKKVITTVPCRKPNRHEFIRVREGEDWRLETALFEDKVLREIYLVDRSMLDELASEVFRVCLFTAITRQADIFLWPVRMPGEAGKSNPWNESALAAARLAESRWIRVASNLNAGYYEPFEPAGQLSEPDWPDITLQELIRLCFRDRFLLDRDHPVLRALRGEV